MKPFDLTKALAGDPVVTRDGRPVTELCHFKTTGGDSLAGVLGGCLSTWMENGRFSITGQDTRCDLFMAPKKRTVWVNFMPPTPNAHYIYADVFDSQEAADAARRHGRIGGKAYPVEVEDADL